VQNTGQRAGTEIAEVYVQLPKGSGENFRRLAGWQRVELGPGESKTVTVAMEPLALATWNDSKESWEWMPGEYTVFAGSSSEDLPLREPVSMH
jgi:beta-glucosidase